MNLFFITGNTGKLTEAKSVIPDIEGIEIDLPEIQEIDAHKIVKHKLQEAFRHHEGEFIVEDTSLYLNCLNGLPGPLIKWFIKTIGTEGIFKITQMHGDSKATARTIIGYAKNRTDIQFFEGSIEGVIVAPRGSSGFGWDPIFQPAGFSQTFAEMGTSEKNEISMRKISFEQLAKNLKEQES